jgi:hypothetical protein
MKKHIQLSPITNMAGKSELVPQNWTGGIGAFWPAISSQGGMADRLFDRL